MSMQALNHLVARSIVDPSVVRAFAAGTLDDILADLAFSPGLRASLATAQTGTWAEFAVVAGRSGRPRPRPAASSCLPRSKACGRMLTPPGVSRWHDPDRS
ncbi:MAG: hypothetical protein FJZ97_07405 [Chloroflexi bacterium]|nr:hypothetical protein [Chloroflexota bacterium]